MKTSPPRRGVALVMVIAFLALITGLVIAFLTTVSTETQVAKRTDAGTRGRELIDTVNALVMSQIRDATSQGQGIAWASQPGMIRTYGTSTGQAATAPLRYFKLYSAKNLVWNPSDGPFNPGNEVPEGWADNEALYTDLNRPITTLNGQTRYPIFQPPVTAPGNSTDNLPVGLSIGTPPVASSSGGATAINPAPMPVRWIYVLRDGRLTSPSQSQPGPDGQGGQVMWEAGAVDAPSENNPIVGRVAYWTDDETSKININTAAGDHWTAASPLEAGSYWDMPRVASNFDRQTLANFQPAQREYQRYPGHPATTYLSAAFPALSRGNINLIASRIQTGGSLGGTTLALEPVPVDADRLYAFEDELIFDNLRGASVITPEELERARFTVTAHSRSPEVNLLNQPRIAAWPVSRNTSNDYRSPFDRLIAFCSCIGAKNYIFDRLNADSATEDYQGRNVELYTYLQRATSATVPGFGGSFQAKYGDDRDQILTEMFDYIRSTNLFDDTLEPQPLTYPTTGKQYTNGRTSKTGAHPGHGQVTPIRIGTTQGFGRFTTISEVGMHFIATADFTVPDSNVVPADNVGQPTQKPTNRTLGSGTSAVKLKTGERRIEAMLLLEAFSPSQGWGPLRPDMQIRIKGLHTLTVNGTSLGFPAEGILKIESNGGYHSRMWGGNAGFRFMLNGRRLPARGVMPADSGFNVNNSYPFVSAPITVSVANSSNMTFSGGEITIEIFSDSNPAGSKYDDLAGQEPVQTLTVNLASGTFPVPRLAMAGIPYPASTTDTQSVDTTREFWWTFSRDGALAGFPTFTGTANVAAAAAGRIHRAAADPGSRTVARSGAVIHYISSTPSDVIRSMVVSHGDYRLLAAQANPPEDLFVKHRYYDNTGQFSAHSLQEGAGSYYTVGSDSQAGGYVAGAAYNGAKRPDIPVNAISLAQATGDWDTGSAAVLDGAYINKPDEGNNYRENGGIPYFDANQAHETTGPTFFSPNRQIPSPVMFGSLPNQVKAGKPWSTLLFRPDTGDGATPHIGSQTPPDHLLLDLFWMPVVEPYAISEPFATAGKINMNHQIVPFTYIERTTGLRALLRSERVLAVPTTTANVYKSSTAATNYRHLINADETLKQFKERFDAGDIFRSASEICEMYLVPEQTTLANMPAFWQENKLTADNSREHPYATLYPRLTTKSNTYRVHYRVQALQQVSRSRGGDADAWATWDDSKDRVIAENRGSSIIERYVDPADPALPDFAASPNATLDAHYRFRILSSTKFGPK